MRSTPTRPGWCWSPPPATSSPGPGRVRSCFRRAYRRVLAACGVMADGRPYAGLTFRTMQGDFGPASKMATALRLHPERPRAKIDCGNVVDMNGARHLRCDAANRRRGGAVAGRALRSVPRYQRALDAGRGGAAGPVRGGGQDDAPAMNPAETLEKIGQGVLRVRRGWTSARRLRPRFAQSCRRPRPRGRGSTSSAGRSASRPRDYAGAGAHVRAGAHPDGAAARGRRRAGRSRRPPERSRRARNRYLEAALDHGNPSRRSAAGGSDCSARQPTRRHRR